MRKYFSHRLSSIGEYIFQVLFLTCLPHQQLLAFSLTIHIWWRFSQMLVDKWVVCNIVYGRYVSIPYLMALINELWLSDVLVTTVSWQLGLFPDFVHRRAENGKTRCQNRNTSQMKNWKRPTTNLWRWVAKEEKIRDFLVLIISNNVPLTWSKRFISAQA